MDIICGIYTITNLINNKVYVGQATDIYDRWKEHLRALRGTYHFNNHLQWAWNKYKEDSFKFDIIEQCDKNELNDKEIYWITKYDSYHNGYNQTTGGDGMRGFTHSEETKAKISISAKERFSTVENHPMYGKHHSDASRSKMSVAQKKRFDDPKQREIARKAHTGIPCTEDAKIKHSQYAKGTNNPRAHAVYCMELDEYFWGATEAREKYGVNINSISLCCKGLRKSAGKHPITGEKLHWVYADEQYRVVA